MRYDAMVTCKENQPTIRPTNWLRQQVESHSVFLLPTTTTTTRTIQPLLLLLPLLFLFLLLFYLILLKEALSCDKDSKHRCHLDQPSKCPLNSDWNYEDRLFLQQMSFWSFSAFWSWLMQVKFREASKHKIQRWSWSWLDSPPSNQNFPPIEEA